MMDNDNIIEVKNLTKNFGKFTAVDDISFNVKKGEIFGLLGPNGAGKSTTLHMLSTLSRPTKGTATIGGYDTVSQDNQVRKQKVYKITKSGQTILKRAIVKQSEIFNNMVSLFREFAHDVLNINEDIDMPEMPSMFSPFLEDQPTADLKTLKHQRAHALENLKASKEKLKVLDRRITELKKNRQNRHS